MADNIFSTYVMSETTIQQIRVLPPDTQLKFFWAVTEYGIDGIEPEFEGLELAIWIPMRDLIFNSKHKSEKWLNKQKENGKKGGRPKTQDNPNKPNETQDNPNVVWVNHETLNVNDNVNKNNNDNEREKLFVSLWQKNGDVFNAFARLDQPNEWRNFWDRCNFSPQHIETAVNNVVNAVKSGLLQRRYIPSTPDKFVLNDWFNRGLDDFKPKEIKEPDKKPSHIPDADASDKMLEEQENYRKNALENGNLENDLKKILRKRQEE